MLHHSMMHSFWDLAAGFLVFENLSFMVCFLSEEMKNSEILEQENLALPNHKRVQAFCGSGCLFSVCISFLGFFFATILSMILPPFQNKFLTAVQHESYSFKFQLQHCFVLFRLSYLSELDHQAWLPYAHVFNLQESMVFSLTQKPYSWYKIHSFLFTWPSLDLKFILYNQKTICILGMLIRRLFKWCFTEHSCRFPF